MIKSSIPPQLTDLLKDHFASQVNGVFCCLPGKIFDYDSVSTTASVEIMMQFNLNDNNSTLQNYAKLVDVPVFQLTGGKAGVNMPIQAGDPCLVIFSDRDMDNWFATGSAQPPSSSRVHSLADGFAFVGVRPMTNLVSPPDPNAASLYNNLTEVSIKNDLIRLKNENTDLKSLLSTLITTVNTNLTGISTTLSSITGASFGTPYSKTAVADNTGELLY